MQIPGPRGPLTAALVNGLSSGGSTRRTAALPRHSGELKIATDPVQDVDHQLALWILYELHYRGFDDVEADLEWDPDLIRLRRLLETPFEESLHAHARERVARARAWAAPRGVTDRIFRLVREEPPGLAGFVQKNCTLEQFREFLIHRSVYHLKEADPHSWAIPRLTGRAKVALVEIQFDEYGAGRAADMHAALFAQTLACAGLDDSYGRYVDQVPGITLAVSNAMSLFGLHRRLRRAAMGHLAAFEASSPLPNRRYAAGARRLGLGEAAARYFDEHVEADAVHEEIAVRELCGALVEEEPASEPDVLFGAAACLALDELAASHQLTAWNAGRSSLSPGPAAGAVLAPADSGHEPADVLA